MSLRKDEAIYAISVQHESDCGKPGIFTDITGSDDTWEVVIDHYSVNDPLKRIGNPCRYTAINRWVVTAKHGEPERDGA